MSTVIAITSYIKKKRIEVRSAFGTKIHNALLIIRIIKILSFHPLFLSLSVQRQLAEVSFDHLPLGLFHNIRFMKNIFM